jgi:hypothetical protein
MLLPQVVWNAIPVHGWLLSVFHNVVGPKLAGLQKNENHYMCAIRLMVSPPMLGIQFKNAQAHETYIQG